MATSGDFHLAIDRQTSHSSLAVVTRTDRATDGRRCRTLCVIGDEATHTEVARQETSNCSSCVAYQMPRPKRETSVGAAAPAWMDSYLSRTRPPSGLAMQCATNRAGKPCMLAASRQEPSGPEPMEAEVSSAMIRFADSTAYLSNGRAPAGFPGTYEFPGTCNRVMGESGRRSRSHSGLAR